MQFASLELILLLRRIGLSIAEIQEYFSNPEHDSFGTRISADALRKRRFDCYDRYFAYYPVDAKNCDEIIPAGTYLQAFCIGSWDKLPEIYAQILHYAQEHSLVLSGYAYEEGLNEMSLSSMGIENINLMDDYITRITIAVSKE